MPHQHEHERIKKILPQIESKTSPTFCLAKWHHCTIYLHLGETHSCYHQAPHKIPLEEIKNNPSALHNTIEKKKQRKMMLEGEQPAGCAYCWKVEAMGDDYVSDRKQRSVSIHEGQPWLLDEIVENPWDFNVNPEYIELSFGNQCNFRCGYCHPRYSSRFFDEIKELGPYTGLNSGDYSVEWFEKNLYKNDEDNPYVQAWFEWWPELTKTLNILRITGGEPLIHGSTYRLLDEINKNPVPNMELNINTNMGANPKLIDKFIDRIKPIIEEKKVREFKLFTSIDAIGKRAEYIRDGLDYKLFERNINKYLTEIPNSAISFMITFNIMCVSNFSELLEMVLELRAKYNKPWPKEPDEERWQRVQIDTPHLKEPPHYDMLILPKEEFLSYMIDHLEFMHANYHKWDPNKFDDLEIAKFKRVVDYFETTLKDDVYLSKGRNDFYNFFTQHDSRRGTDFLKAFPEYENFWNLCKESSVEGDRKFRIKERRKKLRERVKARRGKK